MQNAAVCKFLKAQGGIRSEVTEAPLKMLRQTVVTAAASTLKRSTRSRPAVVRLAPPPPVPPA